MEQLRLPTSAERADLMAWMAGRYGLPESAVAQDVDTAYIAVFDRYITDCAAYAGKLMLVVWACAPNFYQAFTWAGERLHLVEQEPGLGLEEEEVPF